MTGTAPKSLRRRPLVIITASLLVLGLFLLVFSKTGLRYRGQSLEHWVVQLKQGDQRNKALARDALQHFGPARRSTAHRHARAPGPSLESKSHHPFPGSLPLSS